MTLNHIKIDNKFSWLIQNTGLSIKTNKQNNIVDKKIMNKYENKSKVPGSLEASTTNYHHCTFRPKTLFTKIKVSPLKYQPFYRN